MYHTLTDEECKKLYSRDWKKELCGVRRGRYEDYIKMYL
jgi:hypothetical protein